MRFEVIIGSGRARCKVCKKQIAKTEVQVRVNGYQDSASAHLSCLMKKAGKLHL